jgi:hypothetical protein
MSQEKLTQTLLDLQMDISEFEYAFDLSIIN